MTRRPLSVGSFLTSRSRLRSKVRAVASSRSMSSRVTSLIEMKCRRGGAAGGASVVEERLDRSADRAARVEDVVDENDRLPLERKVEGRRTDDRLRMARRAAAANLDVVAVEGDVDGAERGLLAGAFLGQAA